MRPGRPLLLSLLALAAFAPRGFAQAQDYEATFRELRGVAPRADAAATVRDLVLRRDAAEFRLQEGTLYLLTPVAGRAVGAAFIGTGSLTFRPPLAIERGIMRRVLGDSAVDHPITAAVFLFGDSTLAELERQLRFGPGAVDRAAAGRVDDALGFVTDGRSQSADPPLMGAILNGVSNGYFAAYVARVRGEDLMVRINPHDVEEVSLLRRSKRSGEAVQTVCQFERAEDLASPARGSGGRPEPLSLDAYRLQARIGEDLAFSATAGLRMTARRPGVRWMRLLLFSELEVDSVRSGAGAALTHFRAPRNSELWVRFETPLREGQTDSLRISYHGDLIRHGSLMESALPPMGHPDRSRVPQALDSWFFIRSTSTWYPRYSFWQPSDMELTFRTPSRFKFATIGRLVESRVEGKERTTRWVTEAPTQVASFNIGEFQEFEITDPRIPPVTVHLNREAHLRLRSLIPGQRAPHEVVGADLANSLNFFSTMYGEPLFKQYFATEIPYSHGQAFPGLIHLSWWTFQDTDPNGEHEVFRAHEMAHQWWGIGVEPADYRDAWVSEGFATFSGLWYMQLSLRDNDKYFKPLREWRKQLRIAGDKTPPLGLGYRILDVEPERYDLMVYRKGAWILHMLRNLMIDFRTMEEMAFIGMMQDFYRSHRGGRAATQDFQRVVERHLRMPMDWFFTQWVDGTDIPTYTFSWTAEPAAEGRYRVRMRVRQAGVGESFRMPVPALIEMEDGTSAWVRVNVTGALTEREVVLPSAPKRIEFNALESVLADVRQETWR